MYEPMKVLPAPVRSNVSDSQSRRFCSCFTLAVRSLIVFFLVEVNDSTLLDPAVNKHKLPQPF